MYLVIAKYDDDAGRKRIEYILEKWKDKLNITKPDGIAAILHVEGNDEQVQEFVKELLSRTSQGSISTYSLAETTLDVSEREEKIELVLNGKKDAIEKSIGDIMARQRAVLKLEMRGTGEKMYEIYSKKGKAEIWVSLHERGTGVALSVRISGYSEAVSLLRRRLSDEFKLLEE